MGVNVVTLSGIFEGSAAERYLPVVYVCPDDQYRQLSLGHLRVEGWHRRSVDETRREGFPGPGERVFLSETDEQTGDSRPGIHTNSRAAGHVPSQSTTTAVTGPPVGDWRREDGLAMSWRRIGFEARPFP
jgi:hypothetical protein